jgi:signal transduction histidine kinase
MSSRTLVAAGIAAAGIALGLVAYDVQVDDLGSYTTQARSLGVVAVAWAFLFSGLVAWWYRPRNRMGPLMAATGVALVLRQLRYSHDEALFTVFFLLGELPYVLIAHVTFAYPSGRLSDRIERRFVQAGYAIAIVFPLLTLLFYDAARPLRFFDDTARESLFLVTGSAGTVDAIQDAFVLVAYGVFAALFIGLIARKLVTASARGRQVLLPLLVAAVAVGLRAVFECVFTFAGRPAGVAYEYLFWWQFAAFIALPIALLAGLLRARLAQASVGDLVMTLERTPPTGLRDALAHTLGDRTLEIAFWLPEREEYVDPLGRPVALPSPGSRRALTKLEHAGAPFAALLHDPTLSEEPELVQAAGAAAHMALENARLQAEVRAQLAEVDESRARIVAAAGEERRRIERDLHDGAQQRLVALALELRSAQRKLGTTPDPDVERLLEAAVTELQAAVEELRELAHGVHPTILAQEGLPGALDALASRTPLPVTVQTSLSGRLSPEVEATAYFVACEALTNAVKHGRATQATISASRPDGVLCVEVTDDGVGGAEPQNGSGLRGLADRVEAQGGRLTVESPAGGGTRVVGEIPCES